MTAKPAKSPAPSPQEDLQGYCVDASDCEALRNAIDLAFNYRGDITLTRRSAEPVEGYLFDRKLHGAPNQQHVRIIPKGSEERITIPLFEITSIQFTGKDTASGKSFESWIKKYAQKKLAGEHASIESESLDD